MTLFRGTFLDTPDDPFAGGSLRSLEDGAIRVVDGVITERGPWATLRRSYPDDNVTDLRDGLVLPGFVDTHVHYPQVRIIGGLGMPLLDWLDRCALPEEARLADPSYAAAVARDFVAGLSAAGTTSALVFGAHFAPAVDAFFAEADRVGLRVTSGLVLGDRALRDELHTTPARAHADSLDLASRWHGLRRNRIAVIPRFSLSCTRPMLDVCRQLLDEIPGAWMTTHLNENTAEIAAVKDQFGAETYLQTYADHGLVGPRSVFAHNVHPAASELAALAAAGSAVAHCPTSNSSLGSGRFPLRAHLDHGVRVALGSDVGAGTGLSLFKEGLQAYFVQQLLGDQGYPLDSAALLHLATSAGAAALGLDTVGDFSLGKEFDALWLRPTPGGQLDLGLRHTGSGEEALARAFALATSADVAGTWIAGHPVPRPCVPEPVAADAPFVDPDDLALAAR